MEIKTIQNGAINIVSFIGSLDTNTSGDAETYLIKLIDDGLQKLIIDLESLAYISSAGLRILLSATKLIKSKGGKCHISNLNETVQEVFDISGFSMIFSVFNSNEAAISGFQ
jgi:anti-sigma B factor antagonist